MKRAIAFLIAVTIMLSLAACRFTEPSVETTQSTAESAMTGTLPTTEPTTPADETTAPGLEAAFDDYVYLYEDERDLAWEKDIVYLAQMYLGEGLGKGHAAIVNEWYTVLDIDNFITTRYFYNRELRDTFIAEVHSLIENVPQLTDNQITFDLMRIVALLKDAHSYVTGGYGELFPIVLEQMKYNGELGLYTLRIPAEYSDVLYGELIAINGVGIREISERLMRYVSAENQYWAENYVYSQYFYSFITSKNALQAAGIMGVDEDSARFSFLTRRGETVEIELEALNAQSEYWNIDYTDCTPLAIGMLTVSQYGECSYFGSYLDGYDTYYIRLYEMSEATNYRLDEFLFDQNQQIRDMGGVKKLVVDVRDNPGGFIGFTDGIVSYLTEADAEEIYILMDGGSFSAAVVLLYRASEKLDNVVLVGTPAGQPANFFAGSSSVYSLPNHDVYFTISKTFFEGSSAFKGDAVMPDVTVYQNLMDYINGIDTQLQTILNR